MTTGDKDSDQLHLKIVSEFAIEMLSLNTEEEVLWFMARNVVSQLGFTDVVIYTLDAEEKHLVQRAASGNKDDDANNVVNPISIPMGEGIVGKTALSQQAILIDDTRDDPDYIIDDDSRLSELAVPIVAQDQTLGVIDSEHPSKGFYTQQHLKTVTAIASIAATKIAKTRTIEKLQQTIEQLEYNVKIQDTLFEIAEIIFQTTSLDHFFEKLHASIAKITYAENFFIAIAGDDPSFIKVPYCADEVDDVEAWETIPVEDGKPSITGHVMNSNEALLCDEHDIRRMIDARTIYLKGSMPATWLGVPFGSGKLRGVVAVQSYDQNKYVYKKKDKQLLEFVAKHIYNALERMQARSELEFLALHDPLTKLPNRLLFTDRVNHALISAERNVGDVTAVMFLDLDKFKQINDTYGHHVGDELLIEVAQTVSECVRKSDTLCRLGGDEFAVLIENCGSVDDVETIADKIVKAVQEPFNIDGFEIRTSTSVGVAIRQFDDINAERMLVHADEAMYQAKLHGRNQVVFFNDESDQNFVSTHRLERSFADGLKNDEFFLEFQPIVHLSTGKIIAAEALVRWCHPDFGTIPPNTFIVDLEKSGKIAKLDIHVLDKAMTFLGKWSRTMPEGFRLGVNLSGAAFSSQTLMKRLRHYRETTPELLNQLCVEITEKSIINNIKIASDNIYTLRQLGISVSLDDFGTGYSSLSYLHQFTLDSLKIDRSFMTGDVPNGNTAIVLEAIINLAQSLNIRTVAEGIETADQFQHLKNLGCDFAQGFFMAKPISEMDFLILLKQERTFGH